MTSPLLVEHTHQPVYRVVRRSWVDLLDASYSQSRRDNRWNTSEFPALYCCCSEWVARAVALDVFRLAGIVLEDLQPAYRPQLVEVSWTGRVADVASAGGVAAAGLPPDYPADVNKEHTRGFAVTCHQAGAEGIMCRSASLAKMGFSAWEGPHERWGELAIFTRNCKRPPRLARRREDLEWFLRPGA
jgi:RES domain-containing protein